MITSSLRLSQFRSNKMMIQNHKSWNASNSGHTMQHPFVATAIQGEEDVQMRVSGGLRSDLAVISAEPPLVPGWGTGCAHNLPSCPSWSPDRAMPKLLRLVLYYIFVGDRQVVHYVIETDRSGVLRLLRYESFTPTSKEMSSTILQSLWGNSNTRTDLRFFQFIMA